MRSPLNKRLFRELRGEFGKYLVIFYLDDADDREWYQDFWWPMEV